MNNNNNATNKSQQQPPPQRPNAFQEDEEMSLGGYFSVLVGYWWMILPLAVLGGLLGFGFVEVTSPVYRAICRYEVYENRWLKIREMDNDASESTDGPSRGIKRHIMLLRSANLNREVQQELAASWADKAPEVDPEPELEITRVQDAPDSMLDIHVDSFDPDYSRQYIDLLLVKYRDLRQAEALQVGQDTLLNLRSERVKLTAEWEEARTAVTEFEARHNLIFASKKEESDINYLAELIDKARAVRTQRTILESQFPFLSEADAVTLRDVLDLTMFSTQGSRGSSQGTGDGASVQQAGALTPGWSEMPDWRQGESRVIALEEEYAAMRDLYKPEHPKMLQLQKDIEAAKRGLKTSAKLTLKRLSSRRDALEMQEKALEEAARAIRTSMDMSVEEKAHYENLKASATHLKSMLDRVYSRILDSSSGPRDSTFSRAVQGPKALAGPVWPKPLQTIALGVGLGALFGVGMVYLLHFRRQRLYNIERMERSLGLGALAWIPRISNARRSKEAFYVANLPRHDVVCESYRSLRTVLEEKLGHDGQVIMLTSADRGEGKTFTSANIAEVFSWRHQRVLLVDADFRKVTLSQRVLKDDLENHQGFIDCVDNRDLDWRALVQRKVTANLDMLPAGDSTNRASEMLQGQRVKQILDEMRNEYDIVIIDSSPVNLVVDATILSRYVDAVAIIMVPGKTTIPSLRFAANRLQAANIIGYIANRVTSASRTYYSYYGDSAHYGTHEYYGQPPAKHSSYAARKMSRRDNGKPEPEPETVE